MPLIKYEDKRMNSEKLAMIATVNKIIREYKDMGYSLTLRQVYYQLVAHDLFPDDRRWTWTGTKWVRDENGSPNADPNYKWLGDVISDGRRAGLIDWNAIEDRTRNVRRLASWQHPSDIVASAAEQFRIDIWKTQKYRVECWVEKDALVGIMEVACDPFRVPYFSCRGYVSDSEIWGAAQRMKSHSNNKQKNVVIHLGDHDPSGIDMTRDIFDRLEMFANLREGHEIEVRRLALNWDQIEKHKPPPNPAKMTDTRFKHYQELHGDESWELDALPPESITDLITDEIQSLIFQPTWDAAVMEEDKMKQQIEDVATRWDEVRRYLKQERRF